MSDTKNPEIKARLRVVIYADETIVAESETPRIWNDVLNILSKEWVKKESPKGGMANP